MKAPIFILLFILSHTNSNSQNSLIGDGFGGRLWYKASNYSVGSYSGYTICGNDKQLYSWGANKHRELGNPSIDSNGSDIPVQCTNMKNVKFFATGYMTGIIKDDNSGWIWDKFNPSPIKVIDSAYFVDAGETYVSFVKLDGSVWSIGKNDYGVFGNGNSYNNYSLTPSKMNVVNTAVRVAVSRYATIVLTSSGEVYSVGANFKDQLGVDSIPSNITHTSPIKINKLKNIVDIKATSTCFIALDNDGYVWTWGGEDGFYYTPSREPEMILTLNNIVAISGSVDGASFLALDSAKNCYAWGVCAWGECSRNYLSGLAPNLVATHVEDIMIGETFSYIIRSDGSIWASGQSLPDGSGTNGSIWLNQTNTSRRYFTKINPTISEIGLCKPINIIDTMHLEDIVLPNEIEKVIIMPNVFSPNNDNLNDFFKPINPSTLDFINYKFKIFNRWGQELFNTKDITKGWDGKFISQQCEIGTYFYFISYETTSHKMKILKGECNLIR